MQDTKVHLYIIYIFHILIIYISISYIHYWLLNFKVVLKSLNKEKKMKESYLVMTKKANSNRMSPLLL